MTEDDIKARFDEGSRQFREIHGQLGKVLEALEPIPQMKLDIAQAKKDGESTKELVEAWNAVKTGGKFVKWVAPLIGSVVGGWAAIKLGIARIFP
jgi:hypothetical protein